MRKKEGERERGRGGERERDNAEHTPNKNPNKNGTTNESSYVFVSFVPGFRNKGDPKLSTPGLTYDRGCVYPLLKVVM